MTGEGRAVGRRWLPTRRRFLLGLGLLTVLPWAQCLLLRVATPPITMTMVGQCHGEEGWKWPARGNVDLENLPAHVPLAFVSSEDQRFYEHDGFDYDAIRAAWAANREGRPLRGGSTISQQVARNAFLWQRRSWVRKALEASYTVILEATVPKERILEVYLSIAQTGPCVFGVEAGARYWYGLPAAKLTKQQAAELASLLPSPSSWTPKMPHVQKHAKWILAHPAPMKPAP